MKKEVGVFFLRSYKKQAGKAMLCLISSLSASTWLPGFLFLTKFPTLIPIYISFLSGRFQDVLICEQCKVWNTV